MQQPKFADHLAFQKLGETIVVIELNGSRNFHELNETASFLWPLCDGSRNKNDLVNALCGEFEVEPEEASRDVEDFLSGLGSLGLLQEGANA